MLGKILFKLFALCGMTLTCVACYGTAYDEYHAEYKASGRVVDPDGKPVEGIEVSLGVNYNYSNADGRFYVRGESSALIIRDVDGEANGGEFVERVIPLHMNAEDVGDVKLTKE